MHVLLLSNEYPPNIFGGIATFVESLAQGLSKIGVEVTVISGYPVPSIFRGHHAYKDHMFQRNADRVKVIRFPYPNIPPRHTVFQLANLKDIRQKVKELKPDVIHGQSGSTFPLCYTLRDLAPFLVTFHTSPQAEKCVSTSSLLRGGSWNDLSTYVISYPAWHYTFKKELQHSNAAVAVSMVLRSELLGELGNQYSDKLEYIHNGVNIKLLDQLYNETGTDISESEKAILFAGRLFWRKGVLNIVKMAYLLQKSQTNFKIVVHGTGPLFNRMQQYIRSLKLKNIELTGFVTKRQLMKSLKRCKFVVIPSLYEACPMILLESMCLGKIPLMNRLPFSLELTENGEYGVLGDGMKNLIDKMTALENPSSLSELSNKIRCFAREKYDISKTIEKYMKKFTDLTMHMGS